MTQEEIRQILIKIIADNAFIYEGKDKLEELIPTDPIKYLIKDLEE